MVVMKLSERRLIIKFAAGSYFRFNPTNDTGFMVEDSLTYALEEFDTGYDLTEQEHKKLLADVSGEIHRRARMEDPDLKLKELYLEDSEHIRELLSIFKYQMYNNSYPDGNLETLDEQDINMILGDMKMSETMRARVYVDEKGTVLVRYPGNVCRLISCDTNEEVK
jgi:hypothetical protein